MQPGEVPFSRDKNAIFYVLCLYLYLVRLLQDIYNNSVPLSIQPTEVRTLNYIYPATIPTSTVILGVLQNTQIIILTIE